MIKIISIMVGVLLMSGASQQENEQKSPFSAMFSETAKIDVEICGKPASKSIYIALFGFDVPYTVKNFVNICLSKYEKDGVKLSYNNSDFHRIIPGFMIQGGDFTRGDGTGGWSIYGEKFADENFLIEHDVGVISMANSGPDTNGSQFFITTADTSFLNRRHSVFGIVTHGMDVVYEIEGKGTSEGDPQCKVKITSCSIVPDEK